MNAHWMSSAALQPSGGTGQSPSPLVLSSASTAWTGLPLELYAISSLDEPWQVWSSNDARQFLVVLEGAVAYRTFGSPKPAHVQAGRGTILFRSNHPAPLAGNARFVVFSLPWMWEERMLAEGAPARSVRVAPIVGNEAALCLAQSVVAEVQNGVPSGERFAECASLALLTLTIEHNKPSKMEVRGALTEGQCRQIVRYLDDRLQDSVRLADIAAFTGLHPRHFSALFRQAFGRSPYRYLIERRLSRAATMLATTATDISEIALRVGFASQSHFSDAFRKVYGTSPRRYGIERRSKAVKY